MGFYPGSFHFQLKSRYRGAQLHLVHLGPFINCSSSILLGLITPTNHFIASSSSQSLKTSLNSSSKPSSPLTFASLLSRFSEPLLSQLSCFRPLDRAMGALRSQKILPTARFHPSATIESNPTPSRRSDRNEAFVGVLLK